MHQPNHRGQCTNCIITTAKKATFLPLLVGLSANYWQFLWNFGGHWDKKQATRFGCYRDSDQKFVFIVFNITQWNLRYGNSGNLAIMEHDVLQREKPPQKSQYRITADISRPMHDSLRHGRGLDPSMDWIGLGLSTHSLKEIILLLAVLLLTRGRDFPQPRWKRLNSCAGDCVPRWLVPHHD